MRGLIAALTACVVIGAAVPAEAAIVYTRDGRSTEGALVVEGTGLVVTTAARRVVIPYDQVLGVSLDGQPLFPVPARAEGSKLLNNDWLVWTLVAANVATVVLAGVSIYRATAPAAR